MRALPLNICVRESEKWDKKWVRSLAFVFACMDEVYYVGWGLGLGGGWGRVVDVFFFFFWVGGRLNWMVVFHISGVKI